METESALELDFKQLCRKILATNEQESTAVEQVLNEFFILTDTGWFNSRCDQELNDYKSNKSQKAIAGKASAEAKRHKKQLLIEANRRSTGVEHTFNVDSTASQLTINHKPVTNIVTHADATPTPTPSPSLKKGTRLPADWQPDSDLLQWAKQKRPDLNLTDTVDSFRDYWHAKAGKDACKLKWNLTFKIWVRGQRASPADVKQNVVRPAETKAQPETPEQKHARKVEAAKSYARSQIDLAGWTPDQARQYVDKVRGVAA
jgi:uncharacterized protein YdaU (DUF1376 family)